MPPRTANSPRFSTRSVRVNESSVRWLISFVRAISWPTSKVQRGDFASDAIKRWITARIGATTIGFLISVVSEFRVEIRLATVSLRGLNLSWGKVSHAGNSKTSL